MKFLKFLKIKKIPKFEKTSGNCIYRLFLRKKYNSKIKKNTSTHCCVLGINRTTDINENVSSPSQFNGGSDADNISLEKVKKRWLEGL